MLACAYRGETDKVLAALAAGADVDMVDAPTGLSALHIAVGTNNLKLTRALVEQYRAGFFPDRAGRWPSLIAIECDVDEDLADYITEAEARFLEQERSA
ncbi:MAG: ankyrin repeat domain-containing protein [Albidovulum sp.]|nr:MAG: ankyrin repeat domain-containing protein [Defluviimonas sp.]